MKYAIRHIGSSDFLSGFARNGEPTWVNGWDNDAATWYSSEKAANPDQDRVTADGLNSMIEEV
tara:strand:- start:5 stop:193 length:189 start_codon:yes stop_codon:yes gene_type:complete